MIRDFEKFCAYYYVSTYIPIIYMRVPAEKICCYPKQSEEMFEIPNDFPQMIRFRRKPDYYMTKSGAFFGFVNLDYSENKDDYLIIGPVFSTEITEDLLRMYLHEGGISIQYKEQIRSRLMNTPRMTRSQFISALAFLHLALNEEVIDPYSHFQINGTELSQNMNTETSRNLYEAREVHDYHGTYRYEQALMDAISSGDTSRLDQVLRYGKVNTRDPLDNPARRTQHARENIISMIALVSRTAVASGLEEELSYSLCDSYIAECEKMHTAEEIYQLSYVMMMDYTKRIGELQMPEDMSREIYECLQFVSEHVNEKISVGDVADHVHRSRSYISGKFKKELGFELGTYITSRKLEEAKSLLQFTNRSLLDISEYLSFSSQGYFQNLFRKKYGVTPAAFRKQCRNAGKSSDTV